MGKWMERQLEKRRSREAQKEAQKGFREALLDIESPYESTRSRGARALANYRDPSAIKALINAITTAKEWEINVKAWAANSLAALGAREAVPTLIKTLGHGGDGLTVESLNRLKPDWAASKEGQEAISHVLESLSKGEENGDVYRAALGESSTLGVTAAIPLLFEHIRESKGIRSSSVSDAERDAAVKIAAASPEARGLLIQYDKDSSQKIRYFAVQILGQLPANPEVTDALIILLKDESPKIREMAAEALGRLGDSRAVAPLTAALNDKYSTEEYAEPLNMTYDRYPVHIAARNALKSLGKAGIVENWDKRHRSG